MAAVAEKKKMVKQREIALETPRMRGWAMLALCSIIATLVLLPVDAVHATHIHKYDYIVVGGGTAGCVAAARLSENTDAKVLLVSNGEDQTGRIENTLPFILPNPVPVPGDYVRFADYTLSTEDVTYGASGRESSVVIMPRLLGGASSLNGGAFVRPDNVDFNRLTFEYGLNHWSVADINSTWLKIETFHGDGNGSPFAAGHGTTGPINARAITPDSILGGYASALQNVTNSAFNPDMGLGNVRGSGFTVRPLGGATDVNVTANYVRQDSYNRYIVPVLSRNNLDVIDRAQVIQVSRGPGCFSHDRTKQCINEVRYIRDGQTETARVKRGGEIILSAGALSTPKILLLSGIGNCDDLMAEGIGCVKNIPLMGKRIQEHIAFATLHIVPATSPDWSQHIGSLTSTYTSSRPDNVINLELTATGYPVAPGLHVVINQAVLTQPSSYGSINLKDGDWLTALNITFGIYRNDTDRDALLFAFKKIRAAAAASPYPMIERSPSFTTLPATATDAQIKEWLRKKEVTTADYHTVGTTPMGKCANGATVDEQLRVCGVSGLRIADNGVMPFAYTAHSTHTGALIIGEQVARFIKTL